MSRLHQAMVYRTAVVQDTVSTADKQCVANWHCALLIFDVRSWRRHHLGADHAPQGPGD
jgi:hypothetical protein